MLGLTKLWLGGAAVLNRVPTEAPEITTQPASLTVEEGELAVFSVVAKHWPMTYQWRKDGVNLPGETMARLEVWCCDAADAGAYDVVLTNAAGTTTSNDANLTVTVVVPTPAGYWGMESVRI